MFLFFLVLVTIGTKKNYLIQIILTKLIWTSLY